MKICLINSLYKPYSRGGAEVVFNNIVKELKNDGHDVFVITISGKKENKQYVVREMDDIKVFRFYPKNIFSFLDINSQPIAKRLLWHLLDMFNWHSYGQVYKILKTEKPDLVLTHNLKGLGYLTLMAIRALKIKNIHTLHDVQLLNPSGLMFKPTDVTSFYLRPYQFICRHLFNSPEVVIAPSLWLKKIYEEAGFFANSKFVVSPNPLVMDTETWQKKFEDSKVNYLFLGQLEDHKGIRFLLKVFSEFVKTNNCRLLVVGKGSLMEKLQTEYAGQTWLEFLGYIPANKLGKLVFKRVHYTIIPSLCCENSPSVIYDSFKYGTPVLASAIGGIPELISEGVTGYLFEPGNKISLLNKLNKSVHSLDNFKQLSENAKIKAANYDIKQYIYKLLSL